MRVEWILAGVIALEIALFGATGQNFFTTANLLDILRLAVETGLIALAMTCVIVTGGIDLSSGSLMGLSAILLGMMVEEYSVPFLPAVLLVLVFGVMAGGLNALLIARFQRLPLIITLGTYSLYRGLAEGLTNGAKTYNQFPAEFLRFGHGGQIVIFAVAILLFWLLLQRSTIGRTLYAIGHSAEGAKFARIPVGKRLALVYVLSGVMAALAGIIYTSRLGQAKADAGTGYELAAIAAVVLGGTSIFGGSGTISGTLLGLFSIVILQTGLRLSALPAEFSGMLTGLLLITTIAISLRRPKSQDIQDQTKEFEVKNSQIAILSGVILIAALIVAGSNWMAIQSLKTSGNSPQSSGGKRLTIAMMPKSKGDPYFISCRLGAEKAAKDLNIELLWDGPTDVDPAKQNEIIESWITRKVDAIAVAAANREGISTALRKARAQGIKVITWDADAMPDARDFFVNQATPQAIGETLVDEAARLMKGKGEFAIVTGALTSANQNEWIEWMRKRLSKYPEMKLAKIVPSDDDRDRAFAETQTLMKANPSIRLFMGISVPAVPGAGEAVKQSGRKDVFVSGLSLPNLCKPYVKDGTVQSILLWKTEDLGYLSILTAQKAITGELRPTRGSVDAGYMGQKVIRGTEVILGAPFVFDKTNIDQFNF